MAIDNALTYRVFPPFSNNVKHLFFMIHGYGSNSSDLISLAPDLRKFVDDVLFISPDGCQPFEGGGYGGYQWYSLVERTYDAIRAGTERAAPILENFIQNAMREYKVSAQNVILLGFSQGAMMCLHIGYRMREAIAGVIGLSGRLNMTDLLAHEIRTRPETILVHGAEDQVVCPDDMYEAEQALKANGVKVHCYLRPFLGHGIDRETIDIIGKFMQKKWLPQ